MHATKIALQLCPSLLSDVVVNLNLFVYLADWFARLVQSSLSYHIWSCQLSNGLLLYQCSASHVFLSVVCVLLA